MIEISHTAADGTLVDGTSRGDGTNTILKSHGFRWFRTIGMWGISGSRDKQPNTYKINRCAEALRAAGHEVTVTVDTGHRDVAEAEADLAARQAARADALDAKADRKQAAADAASLAHDRAYAALPPFGEPIKIGHHSERRHRNAIDKAWNALGKSVETQREADETVRRANIAANAQKYRHNPVTIRNRIDKWEAEQRADQRHVDGRPRRQVGTWNGEPVYDEQAPASGGRREALLARMSQRADEIAYWQAVLAEMKSAGTATDYSRETIHKGDRVLYRGSWYEVVRANPKTVSVHFFGGAQNWSNTIKYQEIKDHKPASECVTEAVKL
ncbi:DUF3560 domain-containing protein [Mycolicibacterium sphagni]|uniref:DUF3560 domain-containing protein n=1 Tax=Mycolicibacterium sphagni TaxID=1786 RepID=UPI0021F3376C|nr:DUF3560 domain-containing protein [Mycolicibacterium sphagni]